jgi:ribose 5-phosphate isomerase B
MNESKSKPRIAIGADHAGFHVKEKVREYLTSAGYAVDDLGTRSEESVDYPDFARETAQRVANGGDDLGILVCGTGIGMAITANKVPGIRAAVVHDNETARLAKEHNDANVLTFGGRTVSPDKAIAIVKEFLAAQFAGGRHERRIEKIAQLDQAKGPKR